VLVKLIDKINDNVGRAVSILALLFTLITIYDVCMRYLFHEPTRWAFDVVKQLFGYYTILLGGYALRYGSHVRVDLLVEKFSTKTQRWIDIIGYLIFFFPFMWVLIVFSYDFAMRSWRQGEVTYGAVQIPVYPLKIALFAGVILLTAQGVAEFIKLLLKKEEATNGS